VGEGEVFIWCHTEGVKYTYQTNHDSSLGSTIP